MLSVRSSRGRHRRAAKGGYVNDPDDPGGATKFRASPSHTMRALGLGVWTGTGMSMRATCGGLTRAQAIDIFVELLTSSVRASRCCPRRCRPVSSTCMFNSGSNAVRILQRLLREHGDGYRGRRGDRAADGARGPCGGGAGAPAISRMPTGDRAAELLLRDRRSPPGSRKYARRRNGGKGGWIVSGGGVHLAATIT